MKTSLEIGEYVELVEILESLMENIELNEDGVIVFIEKPSSVVDRILEHLEIEG